MLYREYYVVDDLKEVKTAFRKLEEAGIGENRAHVMARDNGELTAAGINATTPWEDTNLMNAAFFWALVGAAIGLVVGWGLSAIDPWGVEIGGWGILISTLFFGAHGAWAGGIRGISHTNYHLKPYMKDLRAGRYLIMVDVDLEQDRERVRRALNGTLHTERQDENPRYNPML